jgi:hypothetical protein
MTRQGLDFHILKGVQPSLGYLPVPVIERIFAMHFPLLTVNGCLQHPEVRNETNLVEDAAKRFDEIIAA